MQHWHVIFDPASLDLEDFELRSLACHEMGHTVGLTHPALERHGWLVTDRRFACMRLGNDMDPWDPYLRTHNVSHINSHYGP